MRRIALGVVTACLTLLAASTALASVEKFTLDNGLTVLVSEMPSSPVAAVYAWVKTGSANEGKFAASGITHFVEHMVFKGTARRAAGVIPEEARAMGGYINASTGYDHTAYILSVPREKLDHALDLVADMVMNPAFDAAELERERAVILKEMRMIRDKPERKLDDLVYNTVYHVHPYQFQIIGREDVFSALKRDDLLEYHRLLYVPNNMIVAVAGGITSKDALELVKKYFGGYPARSFPLRNVPQEPEQIAPRRLVIAYPTSITRVSLAYHGVPLLDPDLYALDVLAMAMGQGESSRLYLDLYKQRRLVESIAAVNDTPQDRGFFEVSFLVKGQDPARAAAAVEAMFQEVKEKGLVPEELAKVKRQVMANNIYERQTAEGMAWKSAADEAFTGDADFSTRYLEGVRTVTAEDVKRVARRYLTPARLSVVILRPRPVEMPARPDARQAKSGIEKVVLPNGLVLLLQEDHALPLVSVNAVFNGGMRRETLALNGLSALLGSVWTKGLPGKSADEIHRDVESRGASLSGYAGRNSFGLEMSFLSEDMPFMMDYFGKFMAGPAFPEAEIDRTKEELRTALVARKDNVLQTSSRVLVEELFKTHPFRLDTLGTGESIGRVTRADILRVFHDCIRPDNGVVAVFGDIDPAAVRKDLERRLGGMKPGKMPLPVFAEELPASLQVRELPLQKDQAAVIFGFRGPMISSADRYAAEVLVNILGSSMGGRIFTRVREELGKAYSVSGGMIPGVDAGMLSFFALTTNESQAPVRAIMEEEFARIRREPVSVKELDAARVYLISDMARDMQTLGAQAGTRAVDELLGLGYSNADAYAAHIAAVTAEDVRAAAMAYLDVAHAALVLTRAAEKKGGE